MPDCNISFIFVKSMKRDFKVDEISKKSASSGSDFVQVRNRSVAMATEAPKFKISENFNK